MGDIETGSLVFLGFFCEMLSWAEERTVLLAEIYWHRKHRVLERVESGSIYLIAFKRMTPPRLLACDAFHG